MRALRLIVILRILLSLPAQSEGPAIPPNSIHAAAYQGNLARVQELLDEGVKAGSIEPWTGYTPLHFAAYYDQREIAELLVQHGALIEDFGRAKVAPIHLATASNSITVTEFLISKGASVHLRDQENGYTPIHHAAKQGHLEMVRLLLENGALADGFTQEERDSRDTPDIVPLDLAAQEGHLEVVQFLHSRGSDYSIHQAPTVGDLMRVREIVEATPAMVHSEDERRDQGKRLPLHHAAREGHLEIVQYLIAEGAKVNVRDMLGRVPLHYAADEGHYELAKTLLEHDSRVNLRDFLKLSPLLIAVGGEHWKLAELLLQHGADPRVESDWGGTPLYHAIESGNQDMVKLLVEHGAEYDIYAASAIGDVSRVAELLYDEPELIGLKSPVSEPPLHLACRYGHRRLAEYLLSQGADVNLVSFGQLIALHHTVLEGNLEVTNLLLSSGADTATEGIFGNALHIAAGEGHIPIARRLLDHGMDPNAKTETIFPGWTPLHFAAQDDHREIAELLIEAGADINAMDEHGQTALSLAEECGHETLVDFLVSQGAVRKAPGSESPMKQATIHDLVTQGDLESMREKLSEHPKSIDARDEQGKTPLHLAAEIGSFEALELLLSYGPAIDATVGMPDTSVPFNIFPEIPSDDPPSATSAAGGLLQVGAIMPGMMQPPGVTGGSDYGKTALHIAVENGHESVIPLLLEKGADVEVCRGIGFFTLAVRGENVGGSPLELAISKGDLSVAKLLVDAGADVNHRCVYSDGSPLTLAAATGSEELVRLLLNHGAEVNPSGIDGFPLIGAVKSHDLELVELLLDRGAAIVPDGTYFFSAFHNAAGSGQTEVIKLFLARGADINCRSVHNIAPIHSAVWGGHTETVSLLLSSGADIDVRNHLDGTPLHGAVNRARSEVVELLLEHGADVSVEGEFSKTPLHYTCTSEKIEESVQIARMLVDAGADINARTEYDGITPLEYAREGMQFGLTPLHFAAGAGRTELVKLFLDLGADVGIKSQNGITPLHSAVSYMLDSEAAELLLERGAEVNARTTDEGQTPLHYAAQIAGYDTLELLLKHGADLHTKDFAGRTPLDLAREHNNSRATVFLEDFLAEDGADHTEQRR